MKHSPLTHPSRRRDSPLHSAGFKQQGYHSHPGGFPPDSRRDHYAETSKISPETEQRQAFDGHGRDPFPKSVSEPPRLPQDKLVEQILQNMKEGSTPQSVMLYGKKWTRPIALTNPVNHEDIYTANTDRLAANIAYIDACRKARPVLLDLEMAMLDLRAAQARQRVTEDQLNRARMGMLGIDCAKPAAATPPPS